MCKRKYEKGLFLFRRNVKKDDEVSTDVTKVISESLREV